MSLLYSSLCDLARARDERNAILRDELQALANEIKAKGEARAREEAKERAERVHSVVTAPASYAAYVRRCSLCDGPSDCELCGRCATHFANGGTL